jgi:hypothetical protein
MNTRRVLIATLALAAGLAGGRQLAAQPNQPPPAPEAGADGTLPPVTNDFIPDQLPPPANPVDDQVTASVPAVFHDTIGTGGRWTESPVYGQVWVPNVPAGWRPYTAGHWADTDHGWAWMGDEPWAWATFHYGRWYYDTGLGWAWMPGAVWAPAWVAWRDGGGYLGWAPLPPSVGFSAETGLDATSAIRPSFFTFVDEKNFQARRVGAFIVPTARNAAIVRVAKDVTRYAVLNHRVVTYSVSAQRIAQITGRPVVPIKVAAVASSSTGAAKGAFYQPPALSRAAHASHHEFGPALQHQVALQRHARFSSSSLVAMGTRPAGSGPRSPVTPRAQGARPMQTGAQPRGQPAAARAAGPHPTQGGPQLKSQPVPPRRVPLPRPPPPTPRAQSQAPKERRPPQ